MQRQRRQLRELLGRAGQHAVRRMQAGNDHGGSASTNCIETIPICISPLQFRKYTKLLGY